MALFHLAENPKSTHVKSCTLLPQRYVHLLLELTEVVRKKAEEQRSKVENTSGSSANHLLKEAEVLEGKRRLRPIGYPSFAATAEERVSF